MVFTRSDYNQLKSEIEVDIRRQVIDELYDDIEVNYKEQLKKSLRIEIEKEIKAEIQAEIVDHMKNFLYQKLTDAHVRLMDSADQGDQSGAFEDHSGHACQLSQLLDDLTISLENDNSEKPEDAFTEFENVLNEHIDSILEETSESEKRQSFDM